MPSKHHYHPTSSWVTHPDPDQLGIEGRAWVYQPSRDPSEGDAEYDRRWDEVVMHRQPAADDADAAC